MKKKLLFIFAVLTLRGLPQSGDIDTLCYLHDTTHFIPEYLIAEEIFNIHTKFYPQQTWQAYKILEVHLLLRPSKIGDTIQSISFYIDTLQQLVLTQPINRILDSTIVFPNWFNTAVDSQTPITEEIEIPAWWGDLCEVDPVKTSGNTIGFYDGSHSWGIFHDLPIKLIIKRTPVGIKNDFHYDYGFKLEQNYPNSFNPSTKIQYRVASNSQVSLKVFNVLGNEVATLVNEEQPAGSYEVDFDASSGIWSASGGLASGIYFYRLICSDFVQTKKMLYLK